MSRLNTLLLLVLLSMCAFVQSGVIESETNGKSCITENDLTDSLNEMEVESAQLMNASNELIKHVENGYIRICFRIRIRHRYHIICIRKRV
ncbi:unnamed protein product [Calicophoron daubneyi]